MMYLFSILSTWRITYMLVDEVGPGRVFDRFRGLFVSEMLRPVQASGVTTYVRDRIGKNVLGDILTCFYCCSVWCAIPFGALLSYKLNDWLMFPVYWLGLSAGSILVEVVRRKLDK